MARPSTGEVPPSCFLDREVDDDCLPRWVPPVGRYRTGTRPRLPMDWLVGPIRWALVQVSHSPFSVLFSFPFYSFSVLNFTN
jgi:hypothetical protein